MAIPWFGSFWKLLSQRVLSPRVDSAEAEQQLRQSREALPKPVIWLLGKTQSGKSSIIRALTGSSEAEIGNGFRPCTRTARLYSFPSDEECLVRFLDTRGLGEANYDPSEDIAYCQKQAHLLMVTVRAMDHAYRPVLDAVKDVRQAKPDWPVIMVQTALHDGYPPATGHPQPYPFAAADWPESVPADLARSLRRQREDFAGLASRFVAVDFTLPEDELPPELFGEDALWDTIDTEIGFALRAMLQPGLDDLYYRTAWPHIVSSSVAAGGAAALPNPAVSLPLIAVIDAKMFHAIASIYQQPLTARLMGELGSAIGSGFAARLVGRSLFAMIPVVGTPIAAGYAAATTYALGCTLCWYFARVRKGVTPAADEVRTKFAREMAEGRRRFREYLKRRA
jgi:uncharacterized protein (DUF697 family)